GGDITYICRAIIKTVFYTWDCDNFLFTSEICREFMTTHDLFTVVQGGGSRVDCRVIDETGTRDHDPCP
ncbi:MAG: hypothetical protein AAF492_29410, partial [Verrucomicrobiota bacterium]